MKRIRGGNGLGDALYVRAVAEYLLSKGERLQVCTRYPDAFIGLDVSIAPFDRANIDILAHYANDKQKKGSTQWQDICSSSKINGAPLHCDWEIRNTVLVHQLREAANGRPIILAHGGKKPMDRSDGIGIEILPSKEAFDEVLYALSARCCLVKIGHGTDRVYDFDAEIDLSNKTSIPDLLDLFKACDGAVGQCSFIIPACEMFDKPLLCVWGSSVSFSPHWFVKAVTPEKILSKPSSRGVMDNVGKEKLREAARALCGV
jgi:hypothetical protein